jgi:hypothetical protein
MTLVVITAKSLRRRKAHQYKSNSKTGKTSMVTCNHSALLSYANQPESLYSRINQLVQDSGCSFDNRKQRLDTVLGIYTLTIKFLLRINDRKHFLVSVMGFLKRQHSLQAKEFTLSFIDKIYGSAYVLANFRYFLLDSTRCVPRQHDIVIRLRSTAAYRLNRRDVITTFKLLKESSSLFYAVKNVSTHYSPDLYSPAELTRVLNGFTDVYASVVKTAQYFVRRKLEFIVRYYRSVDSEDLMHDLITRMLRAYYMLHPTSLPTSYIENYLRKTVRTYAINIIESHTSLKRCEAVSTTQGTRITSLSGSATDPSLSADGVDGLSLFDSYSKIAYYQDQQQQPIAGLTDNFYVELELDRMLQLCSKSPKKRRFLYLMSGRPDLDFTAWLRSRNFIGVDRNEDNTNYADRVVIRRLQTTVARYMGISSARASVFMDQIQATAQSGGRDPHTALGVKP